MPRLSLKNTNTSDTQVLNLPQESITFGRTADCDVELADKGTSRKHAQIIHEGEDYFLIDLKSGNGTFLNGKKIRSTEKHLLRAGDVIKIESYEITFGQLETVLKKPVEEDTDTDIVEVKMIRKVLGALARNGNPSLEVVNGTAEGKKVEFKEDQKEILIGRDPECHLIIEDAVISRIHTKIIRKSGGILLIDQDSRNGTFVNNERIREKLLRDGDRVMLGTIKLLYRNPQDVNIDIISEEISKKKRDSALKEAELMEVKKKKQISADAAAAEAENLLAEEAAANNDAALSAENDDSKMEMEKADQNKANTQALDAPIPQLNTAPSSKSQLKLSDLFLILIGVSILIISIIVAILFIVQA